MGIELLLKKHGFKTGDIVLPGLEIPVTLTKGHYFRNDGFFYEASFHAFMAKREMNKVLGSNMPRAKSGDGHSWVYKGKNEDIIISLIFMQEKYDPVDNTFLLGHEAFHAAEFLGVNDAVAEAFMKDGFQNPFARYADREKRADIGGAYAVMKSEIRSFGKVIGDRFKIGGELRTRTKIEIKNGEECRQELLKSYAGPILGL